MNIVAKLIRFLNFNLSNIMVLYQVSVLVIGQMLTTLPLSCELITSFVGPFIFITDVTVNESR